MNHWDTAGRCGNHLSNFWALKKLFSGKINASLVPWSSDWLSGFASAAHFGTVQPSRLKKLIQGYRSVEMGEVFVAEESWSTWITEIVQHKTKLIVHCCSSLGLRLFLNCYVCWLIWEHAAEGSHRARILQSVSRRSHCTWCACFVELSDGTLWSGS